MTELPGYGDVLCSPVSDARFLVLDAGTADGMPSVSGVPMFLGSRQPCSAVGHHPAHGDLQGGRRYIDVVTGLTLLCIRPGRGPLWSDGRLLTPDSHPSTPRPVGAVNPGTSREQNGAGMVRAEHEPLR